MSRSYTNLHRSRQRRTLSIAGKISPVQTGFGVCAANARAIKRSVLPLLVSTL